MPKMNIIFFHKLETGYFIIKQVFRKELYFQGKNCGKSFVGEYDVLMRRGRLATKINMTSFVGNQFLNIFYLTIFLKKSVFSKIPQKKFGS